MNKYIPLTIAALLLAAPVKASFNNISAAMQPILAAQTTQIALNLLLSAANLQKGAVAVGNGSNLVAFAVPNGQVLIGDSSTATGLNSVPMSGDVKFVTVAADGTGLYQMVAGTPKVIVGDDCNTVNVTFNMSAVAATPLQIKASSSMTHPLHISIGAAAYDGPSLIGPGDCLTLTSSDLGKWIAN